MADTKEKSVGIPIGANNSLINGRIVVNKNGDAEWYQPGASFPTFTSNKSNNYQWQPSPNCSRPPFGSGTCPTTEERQRFYSNTSSTTTLNNARLNTFNSPTGFNSPQLAKQLNVPGANTAPTSPNQPSPDGGSSTPVTPPNETPPANAKQFLRYPLQMRGDQDRIMFHAHTYRANRAFSPGSLIFDLKPVQYSPVKEGPVFLSIQSPISDQNSVGWEPDTMNPLEIALANLSSASMKLDGPKIGKIAVNRNLKNIINLAQDNSEAIRTYLVGQAISVNNLQSRLLGQVLNPNLELLFQGPQLRPFNFTFKMSARDPDEAKEIKDIIRYFKKNMAVVKDNNVFLKAPNVFKIQYQYGNGTPHKSLNLIKMCALTNCSVDYTPLGSYMTYDDEDKTMVAYTMSLQFQELTPIYDSDYENEKGEGKFEYGEGQTIKVPSENSIGP